MTRHVSDADLSTEELVARQRKRGYWLAAGALLVLLGFIGIGIGVWQLHQGVDAVKGIVAGHNTLLVTTEKAVKDVQRLQKEHGSDVTYTAKEVQEVTQDLEAAKALLVTNHSQATQLLVAICHSVPGCVVPAGISP